METYVYLDGEFWDRVSTGPEAVARALGAEVESLEETRDPVCGRALRLELRHPDPPAQEG
jgi:hypothetical protein